MAPEERPTFKELCFTISKCTELIAGYLQMGYNPFKTCGMKQGEEEGVERDEKEEDKQKEEGVDDKKEE